MLSFLILLLLCLVNASNSLQQNTQWDCFNSSTYSLHSSFETNLNNLLTTLVANVSTTSNGYWKRKQGSENDTDLAYGLVLCRGDLNVSDCHDCAKMASKQVRQYCPRKTEAILWKDRCMLHYSNVSFFRLVQEQPSKLLHDNDINNNNFDEWSSLFYNTMKEVIATAASKKYATKEAWFGPWHKKLYMLAQCIPDLTVEDCQNCLDNTYNQFLSKCVAGVSLTPSCTFRYDLYQFYNENSSENKREKKKEFVMKIALAILAPLVLIGFLIALVTYQFRRKAKKSSSQDVQDGDSKE